MGFTRPYIDFVKYLVGNGSFVSLVEFDFTNSFELVLSRSSNVKK